MSDDGRFGLRCHFCSFGVGYSRRPVRIVGMFRPSEFGVIPEQAGEVRRMCRRCRWMNIFKLVDVGAMALTDSIELKSLT